MMKLENSLKNRSGFTLIEIMIVLAIMATAMTIGISSLFKKEIKIGPVAHHLTILSREIRNRARMNNSTYRLVIFIEKGKGQYYVERASKTVLIDKDIIEKERNEYKNNEKKEDAPPPLFQVDTGILKKPRELPRGIDFVSIETANTGGVISDGKAFIHFSGEGLVEPTVLQISNANNQIWSLVFNSLTGQVTIVEEAKTLQEVTR